VSVDGAGAGVTGVDVAGMGGGLSAVDEASSEGEIGNALGYVLAPNRFA
jgi:hypothetical protein